MRRVIVAGLFLSAAVAVRADEPATELKKLEGTWEVKSGTVGGKADGKVKDITEVVIKDGVFSVKTATGSDDAKFTFDPSKTPAHLNLSTVRGNLSVTGIYDFRGTPEAPELWVAFTQGDAGPRPKDFSGDGEKTVVLKLARKKPVRD